MVSSICFEKSILLWCLSGAFRVYPYFFLGFRGFDRETKAIYYREYWKVQFAFGIGLF
jgi:hypothetical protein